VLWLFGRLVRRKKQRWGQRVGKNELFEAALAATPTEFPILVL
jgi:hypothetical protein